MKKTDFRPKERDVLVVQTVKNLSAMWETWVQSLGWEDPLEEGMATHSSILALRIPMDRGAMGSQRVGHHRLTNTSTLFFKRCSSNLEATNSRSMVSRSEKHFSRLSEHFSPPLINI